MPLVETHHSGVYVHVSTEREFASDSRKRASDDTITAARWWAVSE